MSRVLLKLSGESFADQDTNFGIESNTLTRIADEISKASETGVQIGIVVGGGNFFRGVSESAKNMAQANADYMGMLATVIQHEMDHLNGVVFVDHLSKLKRDRAIKKSIKSRASEPENDK